MPAIRLGTKRVEKPWGRHDLYPGFEDPAKDADPIGEVWFEAPADKEPELLIKYLFTSERLSVQVHPDDPEARARGYKRGKDEAWVILKADPQATIGLGMRQTMSKDALRDAALDGSIVGDMDWKPVHVGESLYSPAGTVHAIGGGLVVVEVQQNVDLTYRLYDYGSERELHLKDGVAVADPVPYVAPVVPGEVSPGRDVIGDGPAFVLERWSRTGEASLPADKGPFWLVPLKGTGTVDGDALEPGGVWMVEGGAALALGEGTDLLVAYAGREVVALAA